MLFHWENRYFEPGMPNGELVILVHGLFLGSFVMVPLAKKLAAKGFHTVSYDYPTMSRKMDEHGADFAVFIEQMSKKEYSKIHFVTHSMGGLLLRSALHKISPETAAKIGRSVMLAPPNKGSDLAYLAVKLIPFADKIVAPIRDLSSAKDSFANTFPEPPEKFDIAVVAASHDTKVRQSYTHLSKEKAHATVLSSHTLIVYMPRTAELVCNYIETGNFEGNNHG